MLICRSGRDFIDGEGPGAWLSFGGGVAGAFETFGPELRRRFAEHALPPCKAARIEPAALGNRAAMYGSANEALRRRAEA